jgi:uncharacterized protein YbaR (Trm112 family)
MELTPASALPGGTVSPVRLHVVSLPHTQTTKAYNSCAFTALTRNFCQMMTDGGHEVFLYASEDNDADVAELIPCISKQRQRESGFHGPEDMGKVEFRHDASYWKHMAMRATVNIQARQEPGDILCLASGDQWPIAEAIPDMLSVEFIAGYQGVTQPFVVYPSYSWMHSVYGHQHGAAAYDPSDFDTVIPHFVDHSEFQYVEKPDDYFLYIGRLIDRKGWRIAQDVCERLGKRLVVAGRGDFDGYGDYVGSVDARERAHLMGHAQAIFMPTRYIEPFGLVQIEAAMCGTPVIGSDWGAITDTVTDKVNGFRCRSLADYMYAAQMTPAIDREMVFAMAQKYALHNIRPLYERYFAKLRAAQASQTGWYTVKESV